MTNQPFITRDAEGRAMTPFARAVEKLHAEGLPWERAFDEAGRADPELAGQHIRLMNALTQGGRYVTSLPEPERLAVDAFNAMQKVDAERMAFEAKRRLVDKPEFETLADKLLKERFNDDPARIGEAYRAAAEARPDLFAEYKASAIPVAVERL